MSAAIKAASAEVREKMKPLLDALRKKVKSWWCDQCSQESYSLRCKYCGKAEDEEN